MAEKSPQTIKESPPIAVPIDDELKDAALLRKIDWRILPIMFLAYFLQFLDKVSLNVCAPYIIQLSNS